MEHGVLLSLIVLLFSSRTVLCIAQVLERLLCSFGLIEVLDRWRIGKMRLTVADECVYSGGIKSMVDGSIKLYLMMTNMNLIRLMREHMGRELVMLKYMYMSYSVGSYHSLISTPHNPLH